MADNVTIDNGGLADFDAATDDIGGKHYQYVKLASGTLDSTEKIEGTAANGLEVDVTRIATGSNTIGAVNIATGQKIQLTDGTSDATVRNLAANDALNVAIVDGSGAQVTSFGGSGGTSSTDNSAFTAGTTADTPMAGFYQSTPSAVTDGRSAAIGIDDQRRVKVNIATVSATASGGLIYRTIDLDETEEEIKATAGVLYGLWVANTATATRYIKFYNATAATVVVGTTTPVMTIPIPGNTSDDVAGVFTVGGPGAAFTTAITFAATTGVADADTGAPGANDIICNVFYE